MLMLRQKSRMSMQEERKERDEYVPPSINRRNTDDE